MKKCLLLILFAFFISCQGKQKEPESVKSPDIVYKTPDQVGCPSFSFAYRFYNDNSFKDFNYFVLYGFPLNSFKTRINIDIYVAPYGKSEYQCSNTDGDFIVYHTKKSTGVSISDTVPMTLYFGHVYLITAATSNGLGHIAVRE